MRSSSKKRATAKERELAERIKELEKRLAASAPKAEFEAVKSREHTDLMVHGLIYSSEAQVTFERSFSEIDPMKPHILQSTDGTRRLTSNHF